MNFSIEIDWNSEKSLTFVTFVTFWLDNQHTWAEEKWAKTSIKSFELYIIGLRQKSQNFILIGKTVVF